MFSSGGSIGGGSIGGGSIGGGGTITVPGSAVPSVPFVPGNTGTLNLQVVQLINAKHGSVNNYLRLRHLGYV